jgi:acyl dehydratase
VQNCGQIPATAGMMDILEMKFEFVQLTAGQTIPLGPYTLTRSELLAFAREFDPQPFHLDDDVANSSVLGGLAASGWHTSSILMRMICDALFLKIDALGSSGIEEMKWLKPVYAGEVLSGHLTITGQRRSASKPDLGIITFEAALNNISGEAKVFMRSMVFVGVKL